MAHTTISGKTLAILTVTFIGVVAGLCVVSSSASADAPPLSETHKRQIIRTCSTTKASLRQLHRSDASLRVNRGQAYEYILMKLMTRFNARVASNQMDSSSLSQIANTYTATLSSFREAYRVYEMKLSDTLRIDCSKQPEVFYYSILEARQQRSVVYEDVTELNGLMDQYYQSFLAFSAEYKTALKGVEYGSR